MTRVGRATCRPAVIWWPSDIAVAFNTSYEQVTLPSGWNTPWAACTLAGDAFKHSTDKRPTSTARIVQRRAAPQNACRCPVEQNFWAEPPVVRGVKTRWHQRQRQFVPFGSAMISGEMIIV